MYNLKTTTTLVDEWFCPEEAGWGRLKYFVVSAMFHKIINYNHVDGSDNIDTSLFHRFMTIGKQAQGEMYVIGTMLPLRACRRLNRQHWPSIANEWEININILFNILENGRIAELHRDDFSGQAVFNKRTIIIFPKEFFECFGDDEKGWLLGWRYIFEQHLIYDKTTDDFNLEEIETVLTGATKKLHNVVWVDDVGEADESPLLRARHFRLHDQHSD